VMTNNVDPAAAWGVNVVGTLRVLEAAVAAGVSRFLLLSTMGVARFAQREVDAVERHLPGRELDETWPVMPVGNPYTDTKIAAEHLVLAAHARGDIECTIVRPTEVYGPRSRPWVLEPVAAIQRGLFLLPAHGQGLFNPIYINDLVEAIVAAGSRAKAAGQIVQLGGDETVTTAEYFGHLYRMLGREGPPRSLPTPFAVAIAEAARLGFRVAGQPTELGRGVMEMLAKTRPVSNARARELLGWRPRVDLAEGMAHTEQWLEAEGLL
jgi:nucleoside-diphosphate-sugar epimerase